MNLTQMESLTITIKIMINVTPNITSLLGQVSTLTIRKDKNKNIWKIKSIIKFLTKTMSQILLTSQSLLQKNKPDKINLLFQPQKLQIKR